MKKFGKGVVMMLMSALCALAQAETGVSAGQIVIGQSVGLKGPVAPVALDIAAGLGAALQEANQRGGVNGRKLVLNSIDDGFVPQRAGENARALAAESFLLAAPLGTPQSAEMLKVADPAGVPMVCPFTGADVLRQQHSRQLFHLRASYHAEIRQMVEQLTTIGIRDFGLFYQNDAFGQDGLTGLTEALKEKGLEISVKATYERGSTDVGEAVKTFLKHTPKAVILFAVTAPAAEFIVQMKKQGAYTDYYTISTNANDSFIKALGDARHGVVTTQVMPYPWDPTVEVVGAYQQAMRATGKESFSPISLEGYLCGRMITEALRRSGPDPTRARFIAALESMDRFDPGGFPISLSPERHEASRYVDINIIGKDGRFIR